MKREGTTVQMSGGEFATLMRGASLSDADSEMVYDQFLLLHERANAENLQIKRIVVSGALGMLYGVPIVTGAAEQT